MGILVKFIAVENKVEIEHKKYVDKILENLDKMGLIKNIMLPLDEMGDSEAIREVDEEGNVFSFQFNSISMEISDNWEIYFSFGTFNNAKQLEITIESNTYEVTLENDFLENLKLGIKKCIVKDWNDVIWLIDKDSECLSLSLYSKIYKAENLLRELINEVMVKQYGTVWWDLFIPYDMKEKHKARLREYKTKIPSFNNVDDRLMSIDIDDLGKILKLIRYKWKPVYDEEISGLLNGVQKCNESKLKELLERQRIEDVNFWKDHFSKYLPEDFIIEFNKFARDRNHIMHNKLIDRSAYRSITQVAERIEHDLTEALGKQRKLVLSKEERKQIEVQRQLEMQMQAELDHEYRENDAGVFIRSKEEIQELLEDCGIELFVGVEDELRFREEIEIEQGFIDFDNSEGVLFVAKSNIEKRKLEVKYHLSILEGEGEDSVLLITCDENDVKFGAEINYKNAKVEWDEESGLYVPVIKEEIDDIEEIITKLAELIGDEFRNYRENVSQEDLVAGVACSYCRENMICINEDILPYGI